MLTNKDSSRLILIVYSLFIFVNFSFFSFSSEGQVTLYTGSERSSIPNTLPVWGSFSGNGQVIIRRIHGRLNTVQYQGFLNDAIDYFGNESASPFEFVHDRYPVHYAAAITNWFQRHQAEIHEMPWPASFGDVMPMETIWSEIVMRMQESSVTVTDADDMWNQFSSEWVSLLTEDYIQNLIEVIPARLRQIIDHDGDWA